MYIHIQLVDLNPEADQMHMTVYGVCGSLTTTSQALLLTRSALAYMYGHTMYVYICIYMCVHVSCVLCTQQRLVTVLNSCLFLGTPNVHVHVNHVCMQYTMYSVHVYTYVCNEPVITGKAVVLAYSHVHMYTVTIIFLPIVMVYSHKCTVFMHARVHIQLHPLSLAILYSGQYLHVRAGYSTLAELHLVPKEMTRTVRPNVQVHVEKKQ